MRDRRRNNKRENINDNVNNNVNDNVDIVNDCDSDSDSDSDESSVTNDSDDIVSVSEILYSIESFNAVATPVTITMVVSALVVVFVNTEETIAAGEETFAKIFQVVNRGGDDSSDQSVAQKLGFSLVNTLVIVSLICALTFVVVLCYKHRCMKIFYAYLVLVTAALLGYFTSEILLVAISIYPWIDVDKLTFAFLMYNYAAVGTVAIFLPRGFPRWLPQGYLIAGSVCMAWKLSFFSTWMTWMLLVMLALYDLFAVLTPCGPLKALAELISKDGAPALPGMLYEARLPTGAQRHTRKRNESSGQAGSNDRAEERDDEHNSSDRNIGRHGDDYNNDNIDHVSSDHGVLDSTRQATGLPTPSHTITISNTSGMAISSSQPVPMTSLDMSSKGKAPLVLAKMYQLPVFDKKGVLRSREQRANGDITKANENDGEDEGVIRTPMIYYTAEEVQEIEWTPRQLKTEVTCIFPPRGGRIAKAKSREQKYDAGTAYIVYDRSGNQQRKFVVTPIGSVKEVLRREISGDRNDGGNNDVDDDNRNTIKLGIGDFIFYSLLVSQAAQDSFTAFASCLLVVLWGLAVTLMMLAIKGNALPALPISIFLGVIAFLFTKIFLQPWIDDFIVQSIYV